MSRRRVVLLVVLTLLVLAVCRRQDAGPTAPSASSSAATGQASAPAPGQTSAPAPGQTSAPAPAATRLAADRMVFNSDRSGNHEVYSMKLDGSDEKRLTNDPAFDSWWGRIAPDRTRILFYRTPKGVHDRDYAQTSLWMMNADGTEQRQLRAKGADGWQLQGHGEWSPDGSQLVMFGGSRINPQLFITDAQGKMIRQVTQRGGQNLDPAFSPDGRTIVFVGCPASACVERDYEIFTVPAGGGEARRLTSNAIRDHDPYYSPDGTRIAWLAQTATTGPAGVWNIFMMSAAGADQRNLTNDQNINSRPEWARDGTRIFFHRLEQGKLRYSIFSIRPDGTGLTEITKGAPGTNEYPST